MIGRRKHKLDKLIPSAASLLSTSRQPALPILTLLVVQQYCAGPFYIQPDLASLLQALWFPTPAGSWLLTSPFSLRLSSTLLAVLHLLAKTKISADASLRPVSAIGVIDPDELRRASRT